MAMLDEILAFLAAEGLGTVAIDLFKSKMPATPDACGTVYGSGGSGPDMNFGSSGVRFENPAVQIVFRGAPDDHDGPEAKAQTAFDSMVGIAVDQVLSGTKYLMVRALQQPFAFGKNAGQDENNRWRFACNFLVEKEPS